MLRSAIFLLVVAVSGCATQLQVVGPYANQLSSSDIQQVTALITNPTNIASHLYTRLDAVRPDEVHVKYGGYGRSLTGQYTSDPAAEFFTAYKRHGRWSQGANPASKQQLLFTDDTKT